MPTSVNPYRPPHLDAGGVRLVNALSIRAMAQSFPLGTASIAVQLTSLAPKVTPAAVLAFTINGSRWDVVVSSIEFIGVHELFDDPEATGTDITTLPDELKTAIVETLVSPLCEKLTSTFSAPVLFESADFEPRSVNCHTGFTVTITKKDGTTSVCTVALAPSTAAASDALTAILATLPRRTDGMLADVTENLPVTFAVTAGNVLLDLDVARDLAVGDVLLPDEWLPGQGKIAVTIFCADSLFASADCTLSDKTVTLEREPTTPKENTMPDTEQMNVRLTFELEERTIAAGDIKSLTAGYTFTLTADPAAPVTIRANGKPVARGRLVDVNGTLGVQLTEKA